MEQTLGMVLSIAGATSYYLATRQSINAYYVGLSTQFVWALFAYVTGAVTLLFSVATFTTINVLGLRRARRERRAALDAKVPELA